MTNLKKRRYWVVSPNVRNNRNTVSNWRQASVLGHAAFIGWRPNDKRHRMGDKFATQIQPGDIILIARRHQSEAEIVGFGTVYGKFKTHLKGIPVPDEGFASLRRLKPFVPFTRAPSQLKLIGALGHSGALAELHPDTNKIHEQVCNWIERQLTKQRTSVTGTRSTDKSASKPPPDSPHLTTLRGNPQLEYEVRTKRQVLMAQKIEAGLMDGYRKWLKQQGRNLQTAKYKKLQCDGFEEERHNLIEAKSSTRREHIRMAIGQLLDYGFQGRKAFGDPNMAILVPDKIEPDIEQWLTSLNISLIWRERGAI